MKQLKTYNIHFKDGAIVEQRHYNINEATNDAINKVKLAKGNTTVIKSIQI